FHLPYSGGRVEKMLQSNNRDLLISRSYEERHHFLSMIFDLHFVNDPPESLKKEITTSLINRGIYTTANGFPREVIDLYSSLNFLTPEDARLVIEGVRLGLAAHVVYYVAERNSTIRFCQQGTRGRGEEGGPSESESAIDLYALAMESLVDDDFDEEEGEEGLAVPSSYRGAGDSIALADLLAGFFHSVGDVSFVDYRLERIFVDPSSFWGGAWSIGGNGRLRRDKRGDIRRRLSLFDLCTLFVRDEGRDAVSRIAGQIRSALRG
ncbi:hypothetical protein PFISCL1PPCAC_22308, partial [Pristionchus fissidentatus]